MYSIHTNIGTQEPIGRPGGGKGGGANFTAQVQIKIRRSVFLGTLKGLSHQFESGYKWYVWKEEK